METINTKKNRYRVALSAAGKAILAIVIMLPLAGRAAAQMPPATPPPPAPVNISGFWELRFDSRNVPIPSLTAKAAAITPAQKLKDRVHNIRWCILSGMPFMMDSGAPIDIEQDTNFIGILAEPVAGPRTIYVDGRPHVDKDIFDPTTNGHSIGHWEGDTLVVDTVGFNTKGITEIPGGGVRTDKSHLVEKYRLMDNGKRLMVTFTWTDASTFVKPYTYAFEYYRAAPGYRPRDYDCNAGDNDRAAFLENAPKP